MDLSQRLFFALDTVRATPLPLLLLGAVLALALGMAAVYVLLSCLAPKPRAPLPSEKTYTTTGPGGARVTRQLPCWYDKWLAAQQQQRQEGPWQQEQRLLEQASSGAVVAAVPGLGAMEPAEVALTVVVPAYNEAQRILPALEEMVDFCEGRWGKRGGTPESCGYEILVIDDASSDATADVVLDLAARRELHDVLRLVRLVRNRGKGGGVTHGFRHARGAHVLFADADGASRFRDVDKLLEGCHVVVDASHRGVAIGSRAHLVGSEAVVQRSALRNLLMKAFHFVLMILTPPATSRIRDTQCGFKLFSRAALPHIVPFMHAEGWIFDIEMLMLAESAPAAPVFAHDGAVIGTTPGIKVAEVPIAWHEVGGSKMNLLQDSIRMAVGLTVLRASWMLGVYRRRVA